MRNAPSVLVPVGRSRFGGCVSALAWTAGLVLWVCWWWATPDPTAWAGVSRAQAIMAVLLVVCGAWAWLAWRRSPRGLLDWNGERWCWTTADGVCEARVAVACDWQGVLLVRLSPLEGTAVHWLWLVPTGGPGHWLAVRRALYCPGALKASPESLAAAPSTVPP